MLKGFPLDEADQKMMRAAAKRAIEESLGQPLLTYGEAFALTLDQKTPVLLCAAKINNGSNIFLGVSHSTVLRFAATGNWGIMAVSARDTLVGGELRFFLPAIVAEPDNPVFFVCGRPLTSIQGQTGARKVNLRNRDGSWLLLPMNGVAPVPVDQFSTVESAKAWIDDYEGSIEAKRHPLPETLAALRYLELMASRINSEVKDPQFALEVKLVRRNLRGD